MNLGLRTGIGGVFRAFRHRNYRLFFFGQSISLIGTWLQQAAMSWLVYRITGSTLLLGAVAFSTQVPTLLLGPFARGGRGQVGAKAAPDMDTVSFHAAGDGV